MEKSISINFDSFTATTTNNLIREVKAIVTFKEDFPFNELSKLMNIIDSSSPEAKQILVLSALNVANKMKKRFQSSLSDQYENWVYSIETSIKKLLSLLNDQYTPSEN
ncbi:MAG: hypothetical protein COA79_24150 [Planctomycetota bacterium]|nr:MAG: hypothetical protein COA79_24150 [Planctomycetota bacterium]